jgi:uncharacterized protein (DUF2235 family)
VPHILERPWRVDFSLLGVSLVGSKREFMIADMVRNRSFFRHTSTSCATVALVFLLCTSGCASSPDLDPRDARYEKERPLQSSSTAPKSIFVFLDGTRNGYDTKTNVWRLYELVSSTSDPKVTALYLNGVGTTDKPVFGPALERGMEDRILRGYEFLAQKYAPGDDIYLFGFSRGAHEARALAGLIAYGGLPLSSNRKDTDYIKTGNDILELLKETSDQDYLGEWAVWKPGQSPVLTAALKEKLGIDTKPAEVKFLGLWDTVPGSSFKTYGQCKEEIELGNLSRLPLISKGERYKTDSYPAIHQIAHAVSLDEKRSKFGSFLLCPAINQQYTKLIELWFPGAHADVGGGYADSDELPGISLNWMTGLLQEVYHFNEPPPHFPESSKGLAHWSIGDSPANWGSECEDRGPPEGAQIHRSFEERKSSSPVPLHINETVKLQPYPKRCPEK